MKNTQLKYDTSRHGRSSVRKMWDYHYKVMYKSRTVYSPQDTS